MRSNPFALARAQKIRAWAQRIRERAEKLKAKLRAEHDASKRGYLSDQSASAAPPRGAGTREDPIRLRYRQRDGGPYKTPDGMEQYENYIPIAVRRAAQRANSLVRVEARAKRPHRRNEKHKGPKIDDTDLARHYFRLIQDYQLSPYEAARELASALSEAEGIEEKSARVRLRKAIGKLG